MLDIQYIRENPELVAEKSKQKGYDVDIEQLLGIDSRRRELLTEVEDIRKQRNVIADSMKGGKPSVEQIAKGKLLKDQLAALEPQFNTIDVEFMAALNSIPNITADDVPVGGEDASIEIKKYGDQKTDARDHLDIATEKGWVDFERGTKVAGTKFYFLKGDLALLENAITQFALDFIIKKDFTFMTVPHMVNARTASGTGFAPRTSDQSDEYFIEGEDLSLIATAEMSLTGYHADEILNESDLPLLYAGLSPCYRKEAGTYGKHNRGLFRVHQFNKLEMYAFSLPENSAQMHEQILKIEEEVWQAIGIPYHVINIASGDLGAPAFKKYDIEYWSPVDQMYRELTSCSNCTDYQARNLNIRVRRANCDIATVHTLNGTVVSLARSLVAIIENYQTADGDVIIPEVLRAYMGGKEKI
ncbi:MAG: serine--tRNA ligase [Candidatus Saccharibacteria bacterium]|nr:serine--tRNA ligase [Candidatus Saccharibacteria bacterium]